MIRLYAVAVHGQVRISLTDDLGNATSYTVSPDMARMICDLLADRADAAMYQEALAHQSKKFRRRGSYRPTWDKKK